MTEKTEIKKDGTIQIAVALGVLSVILAVIIILMATNVIPAIDSNRPAKLINVGMGAQDSPINNILHISGYVTNVGVDTAYHTQIHVVAVYTTGGKAVDTWVNIGNGGIIYGQDSTKVSTDVSYSADGLGSWTITPAWSDTP